jgi:hypothetical protein
MRYWVLGPQSQQRWADTDSASVKYPAEKNSIDQHRLVINLSCVFAGDQPFSVFWKHAEPASSNIMLACKVMCNSYWNST